MAEIDKQKEKISFWRMLFFFWLGSMFGLLAYMFNHFERLSKAKMAVVLFSVVLLVILLIITAVKLQKETEKLGEL